MPKVVRECSPLSGKSSNEFSRLRAKPEGLHFQAGVCGCLETCMVTSLSTERRAAGRWIRAEHLGPGCTLEPPASVSKIPLSSSQPPDKKSSVEP